MRDVIIENPVLNSPFAEPDRYFRFDEDGITDEILSGRRPSAYFIPIAQPRKKGKQLRFDTEWTHDRLQPNDNINRIRDRVARWRQGGYVGVTPTTRTLLDYWTAPERERKLFFCQIEALETAIYINEVARRYGDAWIENLLRDANQTANPGLPRMAFKMATGTGKTVVMAMLIAWQALNKLAQPQDGRFSDSFLLVAPGITIRDRLRVLMPNDPDNYYRVRDVLPTEQVEQLQRARFVILNFHAFLLHQRQALNATGRAILRPTEDGVFTESPEQMVRRVCRPFGNKRNIIVINDEAHHCYRHKPVNPEEEQLTGDDRREAQAREEEARVWISGIEAIQAKIGVKAIYDLSATPFFLRGSGYTEADLFPWVVSDFSLIDAIEAGLVKIPRVPVADNTMTGEMPTYRDLWLRVRDDLPKKGRKTESLEGEPRLPAELQGALHSLYSNYEQHFRAWEADAEARAKGLTPPVFIVVCNNTNVSNLVYRYISGWEKEIGGQAVVQTGALPIFRNDDGEGRWLHRPNTILVDSQQLESGSALSADFRRIAAREIEEFQADYRARFPGRDAEGLTDADILREVMNTVGKPGKLGEHVRCVVSVSMLTEGWDANTVTHILGVRAFGTQLLCEQVVGRALRRISYATNDEGRFDPEYAEVYGIPFSFIPTQGSIKTAKTGPRPTRVRALDTRIDCEMSFPRVRGYRWDLPPEKLGAEFSPDTSYVLSTSKVPTTVTVEPIVGEGGLHTLADLERQRPLTVAFYLAKLLLQKYLQQDGERPWLFPQLVGIARDWMAECLVLKDDTFPQMLLLAGPMHEAVDRIYAALVQFSGGSSRILPRLRDFDRIGSTRYVDFDTTRDTYDTDPAKCHVSHVVLDSDWEARVAQALEDMPEVLRYVKNHGLGFAIPYTHEGVERQYLPDYLVHLDDGQGAADPLNLVIEVSGERRPDKVAKVRTTRDLWIPAVNNDGGFGRWSFLDVQDPAEVKQLIRAHVATLASGERRTA